MNATAAPGPLARARLAAVRAEIFSRAGAGLGAGILYGVGFKEGMLAGLRVTRGFCGRASALPPRGPKGAPILAPAGDAGRAKRLVGELAHSAEARCDASAGGGESLTGCIFTSGFAAGWYSALLGEGLLVREIACASRGARSCRFEARLVADWLSRAEAWTRTVLPHLDFKEICRAALAEATPGATPQAAPAAPPAAATASRAGDAPLDVRTWGPVLVLPYSGPDECARALDAAAADPECDPSAIAVVDCSGLPPADGGLVGLAQTLAVLEARGIDAILTGVPSHGSAPASGAPLRAPNVPSAIALAFQVLSSPARAS